MDTVGAARLSTAKISAWEFLTSLWTLNGLRPELCCHCNEQIQSDEVMVRTFSLSSIDHSATRRPVQEIEVPTLSEKFRIFQRHTKCLYGLTRYIAISHVWDPDVADLQYRRANTTAPATEVAAKVRETPVKLIRSLTEAFDASHDFELWYDYVSVPQWDTAVKARILQEIPTLFMRAELTIAYLADVKESAFSSMRYGDSVLQRACGISSICNATWFTRVWTTLEYTQSTNLRVMVDGFKLIKEDSQERPLTHELYDSWRDEVTKYGSARGLEGAVHGYDAKLRFPWQLGPIIPVRLDTLAGKRTCFAVVHSILSRRRVTIPEDFFYAFEGVLKTGFQWSSCASLPVAMMGLARRRLQMGDFSPLFMVPTSAKTGVEHFDFGFTDLAAWGVGVEQESPHFPSIKSGANSREILIMTEELGIVHFIRRINFSRDGPWGAMGKLCRVTFEATGLDVDAFVETLGSRLYGQKVDSIRRRLSEQNRRQELLDLLRKLCDATTGDDLAIVASIADVIGLSNTSLGMPHEDPQTPMEMLTAHGGTLHHASAGAVVGIKCTHCHRIHILRVALLRKASGLIGTFAYRIPGLKYRWSHTGGIGCLLQDGHMVGRFVWGTPTCDCPKLKEIGIMVDDLPMPNYLR